MAFTTYENVPSLIVSEFLRKDGSSSWVPRTILMVLNSDLETQEKAIVLLDNRDETDGEVMLNLLAGDDNFGGFPMNPDIANMGKMK